MIIAVVNSKGGVGKSTLAVHAAVWLRQRGLTLAVVDADAQASTSEWLSEAAPDIRVERCDTTAELTERVPRLSAVHDVVLADGPAGLSAETAILVGAADLVLLPIGPSMMDIRASYRSARLVYNVRLRAHHSQRPEVYTVLNRVQSRTRLAAVAAVAVTRYGFPVASAVLHLRQAYAEACGRGTVVWRMGSSGRAAADELGRLFDEVLEPRLAAAKTASPEAKVAPFPPSWPTVPPRSVPASAILPTSAPAGAFSSGPGVSQPATSADGSGVESRVTAGVKDA